jgi:PilZ domain
MQPTCPPDPVSVPHGNRVFIHLPVEVSGMELTGIHFSEKCVTDSVSRNGASLAPGRSLAPDQEVSIRFNGSKEALARIVGQMGKSNNKIIYGAVFLEPQEYFWGISFAESDEPAAGKALLECCACHRREDARLDEMELAVFVAEQRLRRECGACRTSTIWGPVLATGAASEEAAKASAVLPGDQRKLQERRRNRRTYMSKLACVRQGLRLDIVDTIDVSRIGFRFRSRLDYQQDGWIETAVPYVRDGANIFTPARIAWVKAGKGFHEYGVEYRGTQSRVVGSHWDR